MKYLATINLWIVISIIPNGIIAQKSSTLWFHSLASISDFSKSYNTFVYHDSEGFVWISSTAGLNRFDGLAVQQYRSNPNDSTALLDDNIQSPFFEDYKHDIWFTTYQAIHRYNRKQDDFSHFFVKNKTGKTEKEDYRAFCLERDSFLWLMAGDKLFRFNIYSPEAVSEVVASTAYRCLSEANKTGGLRYVYDNKPLKSNNEYLIVDDGTVVQKKKWLHGITPIPAIINSVYSENDTLIWLGTDTGLIAWNRERNVFRYVQNLPRKDCHFAANGEKELILLYPSEGLFLFYEEDESIRTKYLLQSMDGRTISPSNFQNLYLDKENNLWVTLKSNGLIFANLKKNKFESFPKLTPTHQSPAWSYTGFLELPDGGIWHGVNAFGLYRMETEIGREGYLSSVPINASLLSTRSVRCLLKDYKNNIWMSTTKGFVKVLSPASYMLVNTEAGRNDIFFTYCYQLNSGEILVSSFSDGIFILRENNGKPYLKNIVKSKKGFTSIFQDSENKIYICKNEMEVVVYQMKKGQMDSVGTIPINGGVNGWYEDVTSKLLWVATTNGLAKVDLKDFRTTPEIYTEKDGLPDKYITALLPETNGNIWFSTANGLAYFNHDYTTFRSFSLADGVQSSEFYLNAALQRRNGEFWFGGSEGVTIVNPSAITYVHTKPKIQVTDIKINDQSRPGLADAISGATNISQIKYLDLPYGDNTISFEFVAIEYSDPSNNRLKYKLVGADDNWVELGKGKPGFARYPKLAQGVYKLHIQGINSDGELGDEILALQITINPHWTNTWWFKVSVGLIVLLSIFMGIRYRIAKIKEKEALNTRVAENKMTALRSQMNPHFVFNSLQTVNGFIARQDLRGAMEYVNEFARLMRVILENSREGNISLEREIELLELYMKIESRRFSHPFTWSITVGKDVDTFSMEIPSMLLQPFVENAIKHGLFHRNESGHISLAFIKEDGSLKCVVEDNGVGRSKSAELNAQEGRAHQSRGLQIVKERLAIIKSSKGGNYQVKTTDLLDRQQNPSGTRVEITLPLW